MPQTSDPFGTWDTLTLVSVAYRVTPEWERHDWVATTDDREWWIVEGRAVAYGGRDENGRSVIVQDMPTEDLREYVLEQLDRYGVTLARVNRMMS